MHTHNKSFNIAKVSTQIIYIPTTHIFLASSGNYYDQLRMDISYELSPYQQVSMRKHRLPYLLS